MRRRDPAVVVFNVRLRMTYAERQRLGRAQARRNRYLAAQGLPSLRNQADLVRAALDEFCTAVESLIDGDDLERGIRILEGKEPPARPVEPPGGFTELDIAGWDPVHGPAPRD